MFWISKRRLKRFILDCIVQYEDSLKQEFQMLWPGIIPTEHEPFLKRAREEWLVESMRTKRKFAIFDYWRAVQP